MLPPLRDSAGRPWWETKYPEDLYPLWEDFRNLVFIVWEHLGLPQPTEAQLEVAHRLQWGVDSVEAAEIGYENIDLTEPRNDIIRAFRSLAKSYLTAAYSIWRLMRNPRDEKILVLSETGAKAKEFVSMVKGLILTLDILEFLRGGRRDTADRFDVAGASLAQSYSVKAVGIEGQITGSRATLIIPDDVETPGNTKTPEARMTLANIVREFEAIRNTEHGMGDIIYLGTPHTEESLYNTLVVERGYNCFCVPARWPEPDKRSNYIIKRQDGSEVDILAPFLKAKNLAPRQRTDTRYSEEELLELEARGRSWFAMQYMLDTRLSDADRYPLKLFDLIVMSVGRDKAPISVEWGRMTHGENLRQDIPNLGFSGDFFLGPMFVDAEWRPYEQKVIYVDPAGRGKDETSWSVLKVLNGTYFVQKVAGIRSDPTEAMTRIALDAKMYGVEEVVVEPNFAPGVWIAAFQPILTRICGGNVSVIEAEWSLGQKEVRIIDVLEPVMTAHRLVIDESVARGGDGLPEGDEGLPYNFIYQLTHITRERGALIHDDRIEAVAGAIAHLAKALELDPNRAAKEMLEAEMEAYREQFFDAYEEGGGLVPLRRGRYRGGPPAERMEVLEARVAMLGD